MNIKTVVIAVLCLTITGFLLRGCFTGPEGQIRKQLSEVEELVSYEAGESELGVLGKAKRLGEIFTEDVAIELTGFIGAKKLGGREQVQQAAMAARSEASSLQVSLYDVEIQVAEDKMSASVEATGRAKVGQENSAMVQDFIFTFENTSEGWLIAKVMTVESLR